MTISILAYDEKTGRYGGAATTGSLCVGGWVLRGDAEAGMSASQGSLPSTMWGTEVLTWMQSGRSAKDAVDTVTSADSGRAQRQLAALDLNGGTASFTGAESIPAAGARSARHVIVAGNLLQSEHVLQAALSGFLSSEADLDLRLLDALDAAVKVGGDSRGVLSAALLVVDRTAAPLTLRIDHSESPMAELRALHKRATTGDYADWAATVPTLKDPERAIAYVAKPDPPS